MADSTSAFADFNRSISLTQTDRRFLRAARQAIIRKIERYFKSNPQCPSVEFKIQGSFSMGTIIKPKNGDYDIDIGVYLKGLGNWQINWPTPETASNWLTKALEFHTATRPINKRNCVRIMYRPLTNGKGVCYHVDLPVYCEYENLLNEKFTRIGITGETQWDQKSDPIGFTNWFMSKCAINPGDRQQLQRLVKYIKAWKDHVKKNTKFPSGMALTVLIANNYFPDKRDDISFRETIRRAYNNTFVTHGVFLLSSIIDIAIKSPVEPGNNLIERLTSNQLNTFIKKFERLVDDGKKATESKSQRKAEKIWRKHFGDRFP